MTKARDTASLVSSQTGIAVTISGDPVILGVGNTETIIINGNGRIGIGTDGGSSLYKLETYSEANDVTSGSIRANNPSVLPAAGAYVTVNSGSGTSAAGGGWAAWNHNYVTANLAGYVGNVSFSNSKGLLLGAPSSDQHTKIVGLNYTETARFTSDNKVGIGTTNPGGPLHILGDGGATPNLTLHAKGDKTANWILFKDDGGNTGFVGYGANENNLLDLWNYTNDGIRLGTNSTERVRITNSGTVGIGTTSTDGYSLAVNNTGGSNDGSIKLYGPNYAYIGLSNAGDAPSNNWFIGHWGGGSPDVLAFRYGTGPANSTGSLYLHNTHMVSVGSAVTTGTPNQTFQVKNGGAYFNGAVAIGKTSIGESHLYLDTLGNAKLGSGANITPDSNAKGHIMARFSGYAGFIAGDASSMYLGHNSSGRDLSFMTNETTRMVIAGNQNTVGIGYTNLTGFGASYSLALYNGIYIRSTNEINWNSGDVTMANNASPDYGLNIQSYNGTLNRKAYSIYINGTNKAVGINTDYTRSDYGLFVQVEDKGLGDSEGAIYAYGNVYCNRLYKGGFGAISTGGTTDWNDSTNARSGNGFTLLLGGATNGPGGAGYHHAFSFEYGGKNGTGNMTQLAIPYYVASDQELYYRTRYNGTWSSWYAI